MGMRNLLFPKKGAVVSLFIRLVSRRKIWPVRCGKAREDTRCAEKISEIVWRDWRRAGRRPAPAPERNWLRFLNFGEQLDEAFLSLGLILPGVAFGDLRDVHGAEFRSAHGTEFRVLVEIVGQSFVVHAARGFGIERKFKLFIPVK